MKKEFKGTKGQWFKSNSPFFDEEHNTYSGGFDIKSQDGETKIVEVHAYGFWNLTLDESEANAILISKAPEMLEILSELENDNESIPKWLWQRIQKVLEETLT